MYGAVSQLISVPHEVYPGEFNSVCTTKMCNKSRLLYNYYTESSENC